jgi:hypothetical protein
MLKSRARPGNSKNYCNHWWARQDSNLQPDRYERPALTIELQAPPRAAARWPATVPASFTGVIAIGQCWPGANGHSASINGNSGEFGHLARFAGLIPDQLAEFSRRQWLWNAADFGQPSHQLGIPSAPRRRPCSISGGVSARDVGGRDHAPDVSEVAQGGFSSRANVGKKVVDTRAQR